MSEDTNKIAVFAIAALAGISVLGIVAGVVIAYFGSPVGAVIAIVTGAVGGIVAIVLRENQNGGTKMNDVQSYMKAIVALVAAVLTAVVAGLGNGNLDDLGTYDWIKIALVVLGGTGLTWFSENITGVAGGIIKAFLAASTAGMTALAVGFENDHVWSQGELLTAVAAFLVALAATYQIPNAAPATAAVVPTVDVGGRKPA